MSKMETANKSHEKGAAGNEILNKSTILSLEENCNTLADRIKEANASTKYDMEEKAEERKSLKEELDASEGLISRLEIELAATKIQILFYSTKHQMLRTT